MRSYITEAETEAIQHLDKKTPYLIRGVSHGYFSVARHYGGAKYNGSDYTYMPETDELVRDDVLKFITKQRRLKTLEELTAEAQDMGLYDL